ncbi:MAG: subclass B3 metallo-beta-lactamase [Amphiplicatus sp.]
MKIEPMLAAAVAAFLMFGGAAAAAEPAPAPQRAAGRSDWFEPEPPYRVIGNIYYVGPRGLGVFLIASDEGHILLDGGMPQNAPMIADSIRALGFDLADVRILVNSHAHVDHSGGLAALKEMTGAKLVASEGDRSALETGLILGSEEYLAAAAPPVKVDEIIGDGEAVSVGGARLVANITPGHTRGCTSWTTTAEEQGKTYSVLFFCSASVAINRLVPPLQYEGIVEDYRRTFARTRDWRPDVFLANHPEFYGEDEKRARQIAGDALAFVDRKGFPAWRARMEKEFEDALAKQVAASRAE